MVDILHSIYGRKLGIDINGNLVVGGGIITNNDTTPTGIGQNGTIAAGATKTLTSADSGKTIFLNTLAGSVVTLPAATGSNVSYRFLVTVLATSASHKVQVANASDFMIGILPTMSDDPATVKAFAAANSGTVATNSDTITLNRTTTGSVTVGEWIEVRDIVANTWLVSGMLSATGTEATPFTAAV